MKEKIFLDIKVLIVIPSFRRPNLLKKCIEACDNQFVEQNINLEILVVDNCPDLSAKNIVRSSAFEAVHKIIYLSEPQPGISCARNAGLRHATGEFVAFIDDDEVPDSAWLATLLKTAERYCADAVLAPVVPDRRLRGDGDEAWPPTGSHLGSTTMSPFWARADRHYPRLATNNLLLRVTSPAIAGVTFDPRLGLTGGEDTVYFNTILHRGAKLVSCAEAVVREHVSVERLSLRYALKRSFRGGQIVSWAPMLSEPAMPMLTCLAMITGLLQLPAFLGLTGWAYAFRRPYREYRLRQFVAALGKVFWMAPFRYRAYGASVSPQP